MEREQERGKSTTDKDKQDKEERKTQPNSSVGTFLAPQHNRKRFHMTPLFCEMSTKSQWLMKAHTPGPGTRIKLDVLD